MDVHGRYVDSCRELSYMYFWYVCSSSHVRIMYAECGLSEFVVLIFWVMLCYEGRMTKTESHVSFL